MQEKDDLTRVYDLLLATFLVTEGFDLQSLGTADQFGRRAFVFRDTVKLQEAAFKFVNGKALTDPRRFGEQLRSLKAMLRGHFPGTQDRDDRVYRGPRPGGER